MVDSTTIPAEAGFGQQTRRFVLEDVPVGAYDLVISKGGHLSYTITGIVFDGEYMNLTADTTKSYSTINLLAGDITGSGQISTPDLTILLNSFGKAPAIENPFADITGTGIVSTPDLTVLLNNFGKNSESTAIPY